MVLLNIETNTNNNFSMEYNIQLCKCKFDKNFGGKSIVRILGLISRITLDNSTFSNNKETALYSISTDLKFIGNVLFELLFTLRKYILYHLIMLMLSSLIILQCKEVEPCISI